MGALTFLYPWILGALLTLPILYFVLRVMPPSPKIMHLPSARFLEGLNGDQTTPSHTPWWILLLRLLTLALLIIAFAHPVKNFSDSLVGSGTIRLILDNDWAAAQTWQAQKEKAFDLVAQAARQNRNVVVYETAVQPENKNQNGRLMNASDARNYIETISIRPWVADYQALATLLKSEDDNVSAGVSVTYWLGHGLRDKGFKEAIDQVFSNGDLAYLMPQTAVETPILISKNKGNALSGQIVSGHPYPENYEIPVQAMSIDGAIIDRRSVSFKNGLVAQDFEFDMQQDMRGRLSHFKIAGRSGAGAVYYVGDTLSKKMAGIVGADDAQSETPFIDAKYYLRRAMQPFADIKIGNLGDLIAADRAIIILPDIAQIPVDDLDDLKSWTENGGILLRFAGHNMAQSRVEESLLPVLIRSGARAVDGEMSGDQPLRISDFVENSPFFGIDMNESLYVRRQILAQPSPDLDDKIWARLEDGTPLVTAAPIGQGLSIMVHVSADTEWSDLPLSGVFVQMLKRMTNMAGQSGAHDFAVENYLYPEWVLDGTGARIAPDANVKPIKADMLDDLLPSPAYPPGLYKSGGQSFMMNIGDRVSTLRPVSAKIIQDTGGKIAYYEGAYEYSYLSHVLIAAFCLFLVEWLVTIFVSSISLTSLRFINFRFFDFKNKAKTNAITGIFLFMGLWASPPAFAQDNAGLIKDMPYANNFYLAYVEHDDPSINQIMRKGLENLSVILKQRTSTDIDGIKAIDLETDSLPLFPIIYWPVSAQEKTLSDKTARRVQHYLDHGGTIFFDARSPDPKANEVLRIVTQNLRIPALSPIEDDHALGRSFYLLDRFPGYYQGGTLWVAADGEESGRDGVSPIIIGGNDYARAWAEADITGRRFSMNGQNRQHDIAMRFGVNLVMYALTGNYKTDQVHVQTILERLGQ